MPEFSDTFTSLFQKRAATEQVRHTHSDTFVRLGWNHLLLGRFVERKRPICVQPSRPSTSMDYPSWYVCALNCPRSLNNLGKTGIIVCTASFLSLALSKMRQPKVIAEVLGGILLGALNPMDLFFYSADRYMQAQPRLVASPDSRNTSFH
jgi:hypothetical protein